METTNLPNLKINVLTPEQYETAEKNANELYLIGNDTSFLSTVTKEYVDSSKVTVDTALNASSTNPVANSTVAAALDAKQPIISGAASTVTGSNLTANRVLVSNSSGKIAVSSSITTTELGYLDGVTSAIQTQINNLSNGAPKLIANTYTGNDTLTPSISFSFSPKLVLVYWEKLFAYHITGSTNTKTVQYNSWFYWIPNMTTLSNFAARSNDSLFSSLKLNFTFSNNTLSWTGNTIQSSNSIDTADVLNSSSQTYSYIAIG